MPELSLNILDVAENSIRAKAKVVEITVAIKTKENTLAIIINDDGSGMDEATLAHVQDPFYTTRTTRKVGLGVPFLKQAAELAAGHFDLTSTLGLGTRVEAVFQLDNIDRMPLGDLNETIYTLVVFNQETDFVYTYTYDDKAFTLDTRELKEILGEDVSFSQKEVSDFIRSYLNENQKEVDGGIKI